LKLNFITYLTKFWPKGCGMWDYFNKQIHIRDEYQEIFDEC
jgi:hypothetical protein